MPLLLPLGRLFAATLGLLAAVAVSPACAAPSAEDAAPGWRDEEGFRAAKRFQRGINLGNAWEAPPGTWGDRRYGPDDFRAIRAAGFDHVRLPVAWHHYTGPAPERLIPPRIFAEIDALVAGARAERLTVIVNWHHFDRFTDAPDAEAVAWWHAGWAQIARHYREVPADELAFELLNEPRDAATTARMNELYPAVIAAVRAEDPRRTIFVSPGNWGALKLVPELSLPRDIANLVATGHCYDPFLFTHQGASWTGNLNHTRGIVFPGPPPRPVTAADGVPDWVPGWLADHNTLPADKNPSGVSAFAGQVADAAAWSAREGRAVHVGEFGAIVHADPASRVNYARAMREELDRHGLPWAWWDWKASFAVAVVTPEGIRMDEGFREALLPVRKANSGASSFVRRDPRR